MAAKSCSKIDVRVSETPSDGVTNEKASAPRDVERHDVSSALGNDWWAWELIGIIGSAAALIGLAILLKRVDNKQQPIWGGEYYCVKGGTICRQTPQVSLNSVISLISTVAKICVLIPVTKGLGQLKWVYFAEKDRVLADFETFESATRGLTGSAMLVWRLRARHFAVLGAVAMILSLAFEPFIQNLVHYVPRNGRDNSQVAWISNATFYDITDTASTNSSAAVDTIMSANIANSVYNQDSEQPWGKPFNVCTSNCTWKDVTTVSVQAWCSNVTDQLRLSCDNNTAGPACVASLPNGFSLSGNEVMKINTTARPLVYTNYTNPLALLQSIAAPGTTRLNQTSPLVASECVLVPSVKNFHANVSVLQDLLTIVHRQFSKVVFNEVQLSYSDAYTMDPTSGVTFANHAGFGISSNAYTALQHHLSSVFSGNVSSDPQTGSYVYYNNGILQALYNDFQNYLPYRLEYPDPLDPNFVSCSDTGMPYDNFGCAVERAARAISKTMRDASWNHYDGMAGMIFNKLATARLTPGEGYSVFTYVEIAWYWLSLPAALWALSVVILAGTAWKSRRAGVRVWRTSPLAMVFMGLGDRLDEKLRGSAGMTDRGLSDRAGKLQVRLRVDDDRVRFVDAV